MVGRPHAATPGQVSGGLLLMGGGDRNCDALRWFVAHAGHGHIVVLRASLSTDVANELYYRIGAVSSVETFVFQDRSAADDPKVLASLARADGIFIAGGDQARYVRFWKGTPVAAALNAHLRAGKPLGGTSAGLAILGQYLYGAMDGGSITSPEALADPLGPANTIETDFLDVALLRGIITDTHFKERQRLGRLFAFIAKAQSLAQDRSVVLQGLGVDESAALAVETDGSARLYTTAADGSAWLVHGFAAQPLAGQPLSVPAIVVTGIGVRSRFDLLRRTVDHPEFQHHYTIDHGVVSRVDEDISGQPRTTSEPK